LAQEGRSVLGSNRVPLSLVAIPKTWAIVVLDGEPQIPVLVQSKEAHMVGIPGNTKGTKGPSRWVLVGVALTFVVVITVLFFGH
jgi:hypothetical protein